MRRRSSIFVIMAAAGLSIMGFFFGFHNLDLGHNMLMLNACESLGIKWADMTLGGIIMDAKFGYRIGLILMVVAFIAFGALCMKIGYILGGDFNGQGTDR